MSEVSELLRRTFKEGDDARDAGLTTPEDVVRYDDIVYGEDPDWQKLDVYRTKAQEGKPLPVIISVHGGGWVYGDKERYQFYCMSLAQRGFAVVNFTYRLAPEVRFPAPLEDLNLTAGWILANAVEYGLDAGRIFAVGDSAGAHILSLYAAICTNPAYAARYEFAVPEGFALRAIALNCGEYQLSGGIRLDDQTSALLKDFLSGGGTREEREMISPVNFITEDYPPTLYMTCTGDFLKSQAPVLGQRLLEKDIPHEFLYFGSSREVLGHVFHLDMRSQRAAECNDLECGFFRRYV